jgi:hypothetical protein
MDAPGGLDLLALLDQLPAVVWATDGELRQTYNPLMAILAQVEMLAASVPATEIHRIDSCRAAIDRMSAIVHSMSRLTRLEAATGWPPDLPAMLDLHRCARPGDGSRAGITRSS